VDISRGSKAPDVPIMFELNLSKYVTEIPEFESETQALDFYKGVYLANQQRVDNLNSMKKKGWKGWFKCEKENNLPKKVFIFPDYSV